MSDIVGRGINLSQKRSKALRYLLLHHLWRNRKKVTNEVYKEVTHSLTISIENNRYLINWQRNGKPLNVEKDEQVFSFYQRGVDLENSELLPRNAEKSNNLLARQFALEALNIQSGQKDNEIPKSISIEPNSSTIFVLNWVVCLFLLWTTGVKHWPVVMLLGVVMSLEFFKWKGKLCSALSFIVFSFLGFPWIALIGGVAYGLLQFLDPNPYYRNLRIIVPLVGAVTGFMFVIYSYRISGFEYRIVLLSLICFFIAVFRTTLLSHFRSMPIVFPFLGPAFYLNGFFVTGWCIAGLSLVGLVAIKSNMFRTIHSLFKHGE